MCSVDENSTMPVNNQNVSSIEGSHVSISVSVELVAQRLKALGY